MALVVWGAALPPGASGQLVDPWRAPSWAGEATFLGANTLLGAVTGGLLQEIRGGSFQNGFARGALGGALAYGGRRVAGKDFFGAGLLGREVAAVGGSIVRNASEGRASLARLSFPLGPIVLDWRRDGGSSWGARVDAASTAWLLAAVLDERLRLDWSASASAGTTVFRAVGHELNDDNYGEAYGSVVLLTWDVDRLKGHDVFGHERIHVLQHDFLREIWSSPFEQWIGGIVPGVRRVTHVLEPGLTHQLPGWVLTTVFDLEWASRPWEVEAEFLERR